MILVGRCIQGVGGGGLIALAEIVITDCVPMRQRGKYFAFLSGTNSLGSVAGPVVGGGFSGEVSWRWIFWINVGVPRGAREYVYVQVLIRGANTYRFPFASCLLS